jgi:molybdate transport system ATP-binding protein
MEKFLIDINILKKIHTSNGLEDLHLVLQIPEYQFVAIFGKSGVGKTTLLRMLAGLTTPDKGYIKVNGEVWFDSEKRIYVKTQHRNIGFVFQDYALFPNMTVQEHLVFAQPILAKEEVAALVERFHLTGLGNRKPSKLSGGQQQRLALARALVRRPRILLLDEPLSALDDDTRSLLQQEIKQAHVDFNATTLLVSHDVDEVLKLSDYVYVIEQGSIKNHGKPETIFNPTTIQVTAKILQMKNNILTVAYNNFITEIETMDSLKFKVGDEIIVTIKAINPSVALKNNHVSSKPNLTTDEF